METSPNQGVLVFRSGDNWSHKFSKPGKSPAAMAAGSIPAVRCRESDSGWFAEAIQMARHCDTANRIRATEENARMSSGIIFLSGDILRPTPSLANGPVVPVLRDFWAPVPTCKLLYINRLLLA